MRPYRGAACAFSADGAPRPVRRRSEAPGEGDRPLVGRCYSSGRRWPVDGPRKTVYAVGVGSGDPFVRSTCGDCRQCPLTADVRRRRPVGVDSGSLANRSVTCPTRLETRTKESNMCASQWVLRNLEAK